MFIKTSENNLINIKELVDNMNNLPKGGFVNIWGYNTHNDRLADYTLNCKVNYKTLLQKALSFGQEQDIVDLIQPHFNKVSSEVIQQAVNKHNVAFKKRLDNYVEFTEFKNDGVWISLTNNIKMNLTTGVLYLSGLVVKGNTIIEQEGEYPNRKNKDITLIRRWMEKQVQINKWRLFELNGNFKSISLALSE